MKRTVDVGAALDRGLGSGVTGVTDSTAASIAATTDKASPVVAARLADGLPHWFGPGNEPLAVVDALDPVGLGELYREIEGQIAWLHYVQSTIVDRLVDEALAEVGQETVELYGPGSNGRAAEFAHSVISEELKCLTGMSEREAETRVAFSVSAPAATRRLTEGLRNGTCTWEKARYVHERTSGLDSIAADYVASKALAAPRTGEVVSWRTFTDRVRRAVDAATDSETKREQAKDGRHAWIELTSHGMAEFGINGESARVIAAYERIDATARQKRTDGDPRTLKQLRSDIALDLLLTGELPRYDAPLPTGRIAVTVSLASLLSLTDEPGQTRFGDLPAAVVRQIAAAEGTTLARIVTDPLDGSVIDASTDSYRPTAAMRRYITARDRTCRAPGCAVPAERCDLDHGVNWPHGPTTPTNLTAKHRRHHEFKTRRIWHAEQQPDGTVTWRTLCGTYTSYPARYDTDPDDAHDAALSILDREPDTVAQVLASIEAEHQAEWRRRWRAYRTEVETCDRIRHDDCPDHSTWADPADPGLDFGVDNTPCSLTGFLRFGAPRSRHVKTIPFTDSTLVLSGADEPPLPDPEKVERQLVPPRPTPDTSWNRPDPGPPPF